MVDPPADEAAGSTPFPVAAQSLAGSVRQVRHVRHCSTQGLAQLQIGGVPGCFLNAVAAADRQAVGAVERQAGHVAHRGVQRRQGSWTEQQLGQGGAVAGG